jgi:smad nuclear-interacting protein 1
MFEIMGKSGLGRRGDRSGADVHSISTSGLPRQPVWGNAALEEEVAPQSQDKPVVAEKANFGLTGALAKDVTTGNVYNGVVLKWSEPLDAANPDKNWRMYVFRGDEVVETLHLHRQSAYLVGREEKIADIKVLNPSCSKQHAVIQFRRVAVASADPEAPPKKVIKPYIMDLESTNKTFLNGTAIEPSRYIELREKDILKFGTSAKEYVLVCEKN